VSANPLPDTVHDKLRDGRPGRDGRATTSDDLASQLATEMAQCWQAGERPFAEEFLNRHPDLLEQPEAAVQLIYEEVCLRQEYEHAASVADLLDRFPQWREQLEVLLACHRLLQDSPAVPELPNAGESVADFDLVAELGRGALGRVFLATQPALGDRHVVVKITSCSGGEHLSLARLLHSHIVPL